MGHRARGSPFRSWSDHRGRSHRKRTWPEGPPSPQTSTSPRDNLTPPASTGSRSRYAAFSSSLIQVTFSLPPLTCCRIRARPTASRSALRRERRTNTLMSVTRRQATYSYLPTYLSSDPPRRLPAIERRRAQRRGQGLDRFSVRILPDPEIGRLMEMFSCSPRAPTRAISPRVDPRQRTVSFVADTDAPAPTATPRWARCRPHSRHPAPAARIDPLDADGASDPHGVGGHGVGGTASGRDDPG